MLIIRQFGSFAGRNLRVWPSTILAILFLVSQPAYLDASLDPNRPINQFLLHTWQSAQGLPQNSVTSIAQTDDGYMWLGTEEGLSRFDGVRLLTSILIPPD